MKQNDRFERDALDDYVKNMQRLESYEGGGMSEDGGSLHSMGSNNNLVTNKVKKVKHQVKELNKKVDMMLPQVQELNQGVKSVRQQIQAGNATAQQALQANNMSNLMNNGMMGYLGMASPAFIADAMIYKMKQGVMNNAYAPGSNTFGQGMGQNNRAEGDHRNTEMEMIVREMQQQNEMLRKRDAERSDKLKFLSAKALKYQSDASVIPNAPKKKPAPINPMKMAEVFDPFQFIPSANKSSLRS